MGCDVFANNNEISCKEGGNKVIAEFPDVCMSPPSPPAGPIPVPYPDTSFSKDMKNGSKTVKIKGGEVMLKDKSFYKTSPLGDEAATRSFGANVITHTITGKTYFVAWSMDVKFEGQNVDRHLDLTTSNHNPKTAAGTGPIGPSTGASTKKDKCGKQRAEIYEKRQKLRKEIRKYDPVEDAKGGFTMRGGKKTKPGGHYEEMRHLQRGLRNDLQRFNNECRDSGIKLDKDVNKEANREIQPPPGFPRIPL